MGCSAAALYRYCSNLFVLVTVILSRCLVHVVEEASRSHSETDDSTTSPGKHSASVVTEPSAMMAARDEERQQSDDESTDVEDMEDTNKPASNIVHAGDGDKVDGTLLTLGCFIVMCFEKIFLP